MAAGLGGGFDYLTVVEVTFLCLTAASAALGLQIFPAYGNFMKERKQEKRDLCL